jgi:hypothetical protein
MAGMQEISGHVYRYEGRRPAGDAIRIFAFKA